MVKCLPKKWVLFYTKRKAKQATHAGELKKTAVCFFIKVSLSTERKMPLKKISGI